MLSLIIVELAYKFLLTSLTTLYVKNASKKLEFNLGDSTPLLRNIIKFLIHEKTTQTTFDGSIIRFL